MRSFGRGRDLMSIGAAAVALLLGSGGATADGPRSHQIGVSDRHGATDWSGFYFGGQLGGAWSDLDWQYQNANYFNTLGPVVVGNNLSQDPSGVIGGILGGYNYQTGPWVFGLELSASSADMREERPSPFFPALDASTSRIDWVASAAGRLGYAWDRWLVFAKGGWAGADVELTLSDASAAVYGSEYQWANGWTVGAGGEYMICDHISLGVAYDYVDITVDNKTVNCPACNGVGAGFGTPVVDAEVKVQSVMGRLIFHQ